jgi:hypothetical protein
MKKILLLAALLATATSMFGQGVVLFNNRVGTSPNFTVDAPITDPSGQRVNGNDSQWRVALYGAAGSGAPESSMAIMTNPQTGQGVVGFRGTSAATYGYVNVGTEGNRSLPGLGYNSPVTVQVRAWGGGYASYEAATAAGAPTGKSVTLNLTTTLSDTDPAIPPLVGLNSFQIVPEPSSIALGLLGLGALALIRRRK